MSDSIDLLEAVGRDASLRRLPGDELARRLKKAGASDVLASAAIQRNSAVLCEEFGVRVMGQPNSGNTPFREEPIPLKTPFPGEEEDEGEQGGEQHGSSNSSKAH
jgi:hypothetical protein